MRARDFKELIVLPVLEKLSALVNIDFSTKAAVDLLVGTALHESGGLKFIKQVNSYGVPVGPALSFYQMEPATIRDLYTNYLAFRPELLRAVEQFKIVHLDNLQNVVVNLAYATALARIKYYRVKEALPGENNPSYIQALGEYWKAHWNTALGKGTVVEFVKNYNLYMKEK